MEEKIIVDEGDKVINIHTDELFIVERVFTMRKLGGGKCTPNNTWKTKQYLDARDWKLYSDSPPPPPHLLRPPACSLRKAGSGSGSESDG